jgi:3-oxoacyl-[acyl-carrier-protein] synthase II
MASARRVVITGLGVICPLGQTPEALWESLAARRSAVGPLESFAADNLPTSFGAEAKEFSGAIDDFGPLDAETKKQIRKGTKVMCRETLMGVAAAQRALGSAKIASGTVDPERAGAVFGSDYMLTMPEDFSAGIAKCLVEETKFDFTRWATEGLPQVTPLWLLKYLPNMPASHLAIFNDMRGPSNSITLREASANLAVGEAFRTIARGDADLMVAGSTGTRVHPMKLVHAVTQEEVAGNGADPARASRPFDRDRTGMVLGEGAGAVVLEELGAAQARGATIYGEVVGAGSSTVIDRKGVANRQKALASAMRAALQDAGLKPTEIGHVHAHGLSTRSGDREEAQAIRDVFGSQADTLPVTTIKGNFGNLGAGSGLVELIASVLALDKGVLFPILNYETPDPECPIFAVTQNDTPAGQSVLNVNVTPQGQASAVIVRRWA